MQTKAGKKMAKLQTKTINVYKALTWPVKSSVAQYRPKQAKNTKITVNNCNNEYRESGAKEKKG